MIVIHRDPIELQVQLANESSIGNTGPKHCAYAPVRSVVQLSANFSIFFSGVFALWHYRETASQSVHGVNKMKLQPQQQITSRRFQSGQMSRFVKYLPFPTTSFTWLRAARRVTSFFSFFKLLALLRYHGLVSCKLQPAPNRLSLFGVHRQRYTGIVKSFRTPGPVTKALAAGLCDVPCQSQHHHHRRRRRGRRRCLILMGKHSTRLLG